MKPLYWLIVAVTSVLTNRTASFRFGTNETVMCERGLRLRSHVKVPYCSETKLSHSIGEFSE